jgi:hypothetical protein
MKILFVMTATLLLLVVPAQAEDVLSVTGTLMKDDPPNKHTKKPCKVHEVKLVAGKVYQIDLKATEKNWDPYLILEDASGKLSAADDDSGGFLDARIIIKARTDGTYRLVATTFDDLQLAQVNYSLAVTEKK